MSDRRFRSGGVLVLVISLGMLSCDQERPSPERHHDNSRASQKDYQSGKVSDRSGEPKHHVRIDLRLRELNEVVDSGAQLDDFAAALRRLRVAGLDPYSSGRVIIRGLGEDEIIDIYRRHQDRALYYAESSGLFKSLVDKVCEKPFEEALSTLESLGNLKSNSYVVSNVLLKIERETASGEISAEELYREVDGRLVSREFWGVGLDAGVLVGGLLEVKPSIEGVVESLENMGAGGTFVDQMLVGYYCAIPPRPGLVADDREYLLRYLSQGSHHGVEKLIDRLELDGK